MQSLAQVRAEAGGSHWQRLPDWRVKVWDYPDESREVVAYTIGYKETQAMSIRAMSCPPALRRKRGESAHREANREFAARRARSMIRRKIRMAGFDRILTLTYRENVTDRERVKRDWQKFVRLVRKVIGEFSYIAVLEAQERGALHVHAAIRGYMHANLVRKLWRVVCGQGNIDIGRARKDGPKKVARYIGKYLAKEFSAGPLNAKRYWCSERIDVPCMSVCLEPEHFTSEDLGAVVGELLPFFGGAFPKEKWFSLGGGVVWLSS